MTGKEMCQISTSVRLTKGSTNRGACRLPMVSKLWGVSETMCAGEPVRVGHGGHRGAAGCNCLPGTTLTRSCMCVEIIR